MRADRFLAEAETLPWGGLGDLAGEGGLVVVAPHPDDESLGCGGLIAMAAAQGRAVRLVVVSDGAGSHPRSRAYPPERLRTLREAETLEAAAALGLGAEHVRFLRLPDRSVPAAGPVAEAAAAAIADTARACEAGALLVTWAHDPHCDHQACAALARLAHARLRAGARGARLFAYPVWGWALPGETEVGPAPRGLRLDVTAESPAKAAAVAAHRSQTTDLIDDDPAGFRLDAAMLARFARPFEIYLTVEAGAPSEPRPGEPT